MSLLSRLVAPAAGELKLPVHQFMAALAEYKRGAPSVTLASIATAFGLSAGEQTELATFAGQLVGDIINREMVHDILMLGESNIYDLATCSSRLLTPAAPNLTNLQFLYRIEALKIGFNDFTLAGCAVTAQGSPNMTLAVSKGSVLSLGNLRAVAAGNVTIAAAHATLPRLDLVAVDASGAKVVRLGTAAQTPLVSGYQTGDVPLSLVYIPPLDTTIDQLLDVRNTVTSGPITVGKITTPVTFNNTLAQQVFITLTMPSGLFLAGKTLRVRCGGNMLLNSGTPTVTLAIAYGGTVMFADPSVAAVASATRLAWDLDFVLQAQANNDQSLNGLLQLGLLTARTAATNGIGDVGTDEIGAATPFSGAAAIDSDAGNRDLQVAWTMSVANAANEIVMEYATAELI